MLTRISFGDETLVTGVPHIHERIAEASAFFRWALLMLCILQEWVWGTAMPTLNSVISMGYKMIPNRNACNHKSSLWELLIISVTRHFQLLRASCIQQYYIAIHNVSVSITKACCATTWTTSLVAPQLSISRYVAVGGNSSQLIAPDLAQKLRFLALQTALGGTLRQTCLPADTGMKRLLLPLPIPLPRSHSRLQSNPLPNSPCCKICKAVRGQDHSDLRAGAHHFHLVMTLYEGRPSSICSKDDSPYCPEVPQGQSHVCLFSVLSLASGQWLVHKFFFSLFILCI